MATRKKEEEPASTAVATTAGAAVAVAPLIDFAADAGAGMENVSARDVQIPLLMIAQAKTPQAGKRDAKYIDGCEEGDIFNSVTQDLYKGAEGIRAIPCGFQKVMIEWAPRESGGGLKGRHDMSSPIVVAALQANKRNEKGALLLPNGNELKETAEHYILLVDEDGSANWIMQPMQSTQLKVSRRWLTLQTGHTMMVNGAPVQMPSFAFVYNMKTVEEKNNKGSWFNWAIEGKGEQITDPALYQKAREFAAKIKEGLVKANLSTMDAAASTSDDDEDDAPF